MTGDRKNKDDTVMGKIPKWVPLGALALASAVAWGSQQTTTAAHERRILQNETVLSKLTEMQSRIDERTQNTAEAVKENKALILQILREVTNGLERNR